MIFFFFYNFSTFLPISICTLSSLLLTNTHTDICSRTLFISWLENVKNIYDYDVDVNDQPTFKGIDLRRKISCSGWFFHFSHYTHVYWYYIISLETLGCTQKRKWFKHFSEKFNIYSPENFLTHTRVIFTRIHAILLNFLSLTLSFLGIDCVGRKNVMLLLLVLFQLSYG